MGRMYVSKLQALPSVTVKIIADQRRIDAYGKTGLFLNGTPCSFDFVTPDTVGDSADLVMVAVKYTHLEQGIRDLRNFVGKNTTVISLLNGISSEELIGQAVGMEHMLYAYGVGMDAVREGTSVHYTNMGKIVFGEKNNGMSTRVSAVKDLFDRAGIPYEVPENIIRSLWRKFMLNVGGNQISAILNAPYGVFQQNPEARELMIMAGREVVMLSRTCGIDLNDEVLNDFVTIINSLDPEGKTSMLQDMEAGRKTEVDLFAGTVSELGKKYGIQTPVNEMIYRLIHVLEQFN